MIHEGVLIKNNPAGDGESCLASGLFYSSRFDYFHERKIFFQRENAAFSHYKVLKTGLTFGRLSETSLFIGFIANFLNNASKN